MNDIKGLAIQVCGWGMRACGCVTVAASLSTLLGGTFFLMFPGDALKPTAVTNEFETAEIDTPAGIVSDNFMVGNVKIDTGSSYVLLAIYFTATMLTLWKGLTIWQAGTIGLDMVNDAENIEIAANGRLNKKVELDIAQLRLSGTGRA